MLPHFRRRRRGDPRLRELCPQPRARGASRRDPRHGDGHRPRHHLHGQERHKTGRLRHDARRRRTPLRQDQPQAVRGAGRGIARLFLCERADHVRSLRALPPRKGGRAHRQRRHDLWREIRNKPQRGFNF